MENTFSDAEKLRLPTADEKVTLTSINTGTTTTVTPAQKVILNTLTATPPTYSIPTTAEHTTLTNTKTILDSLVGTPTNAVVTVAEHTTLTNTKSILDSLIGTPTNSVVTVAEHTTLTNSKSILDSLIGTPTNSVVTVAEHTTLTDCKSILDGLIGTPTHSIPTVDEHTTLTNTKSILDTLVGTPTNSVVTVAEHTTLTDTKSILDGLIGTPTHSIPTVDEHTTLTNTKSILDTLVGTPTNSVVTVDEHTTLTNTKSILDTLVGTPTNSVVTVAEHTTLTNSKSILDSLIGTPTHAVVTVAEGAALTRIYRSPLYCYLGAPDLADGSLLVLDHAWTDGVIVPLTTLDVPRTINAVLTDGDDSCAGTLTIVGVDNQGRNVTETLTVVAAPGGKTLTGTKIFQTITSITLSSTSGGGVGDVLNIGSGTVIGLPFDITAAGSVKVTYFDGAAVVPVISTGTSTSGLDASASVYDGTKVLFSLVQAV